MEKLITRSDIDQMNKRHRVQFVNCLPGFKSANLIGTINEEGRTNLAIFSSFIHMGSDPAIFGFVTRPTSVQRHTYLNIREIKYYTVNSVDSNIYLKAHQSSGRYDASTSEFDACGLTAEFYDNFPAPYVKESSVKLGLEFLEECPIKANDTILVIGKLLEVRIPESIYMPDGYVDIEAANSVTITGLDSYHQTKRLARLSYAKPDKEIEVIG